MPPRPTVGAPQVPTERRSADVFAEKPGGPQTVPTYVVPTQNGKAVLFTAKLAIDADGAGDYYKGDRTGRPKTALIYPDGASLNPGRLPFIVVPVDFSRAHPDVQLGDYAAVTYGGKTLYSIVGDKGPRGVVGEGSMALAAGLGIDPDPNKGGVDGGVTYVILPGTRDRNPPRDAGEIQTKGHDLFLKAGIPVR